MSDETVCRICLHPCTIPVEGCTCKGTVGFAHPECIDIEAMKCLWCGKAYACEEPAYWIERGKKSNYSKRWVNDLIKKTINGDKFFYFYTDHWATLTHDSNAVYHIISCFIASRLNISTAEGGQIIDVRYDHERLCAERKRTENTTQPTEEHNAPDLLGSIASSVASSITSFASWLFDDVYIYI